MRTGFRQHEFRLALALSEDAIVFGNMGNDVFKILPSVGIEDDFILVLNADVSDPDSDLFNQLAEFWAIKDNLDLLSVQECVALYAYGKIELGHVDPDNMYVYDMIYGENLSDFESYASQRTWAWVLNEAPDFDRRMAEWRRAIEMAGEGAGSHEISTAMVTLTACGESAPIHF